MQVLPPFLVLHLRADTFSSLLFHECIFQRGSKYFNTYFEVFGLGGPNTS